jgi:NADPH-dependent curcumin reductase CurA
MVANKGVIFKKAPEGWPVVGEHLAVEARDFDPDASPPRGGITTKNLYASFDPYMRGRMRSPETKQYRTPFALGKPILSHTIAKVLRSNSERFEPDDIIVGVMPMEEYSTLEPTITPTLNKIDNPYGLDLSLFIGALGMPGLTAYSSLYEIGKPKRDETIFISAASGAVGQIVGQLAKREGLKVIGSVGRDDKLEFITNTLGFDGGFNYKKEKPTDALRRLVPDGIDIYYENVGGEHLEAAIDAMKTFGRIGRCFPLSCGVC